MKTILLIISIMVLFLSETNAQVFTNYTEEDGLVSNEVYSIAIDADGNKWFGTYEGVSKFDGTNWTTYTTEDGLADNNVNAIAIDADGNKWFGTGAGVSKFDGTTWTTYTEEDGLGANYVLSIAIDADDNKWFGTQGGVSKLSDDNVGIIQKLVNENRLNIYPNPMGESIQIKTSNGERIQRIELLDISGKVVRNIDKINSDQLTLPRAELNSGTYLLKIYADRLYIQKVIIE